MPSLQLRQLHFTNSLILNSTFRYRYLAFKARETSPQILAPSVDPYLNRCVNYAIGAGLLKQKDVKSGFKVVLTPAGAAFVADLRKAELATDIFVVAKEVGRMSETEISAALREGL